MTAIAGRFVSVCHTVSARNGCRKCPLGSADHQAALEDPHASDWLVGWKYEKIKNAVLRLVGTISVCTEPYWEHYL